MSKIDAKRKLDILKAINNPLNANMDEMECRKWMCILPEAKRYINNKIKICQKRIDDIVLELELLEAEVFEEVRAVYKGSATERKSVIEMKYRQNENYAKLYAEMYRYKALIEQYSADLDNLTEKSFAVRKIADFERVHLMYAEDED